MEGYKVQLYLKAPLFPFDFEDGSKRSTFPSNIVVLEGVVKGDAGGGYWLSGIKASPRGGVLKDVAGLSEAVIPGGKVDFVRVIEAPASDD